MFKLDITEWLLYGIVAVLAVMFFTTDVKAEPVGYSGPLLSVVTCYMVLDANGNMDPNCKQYDYTMQQDMPFCEEVAKAIIAQSKSAVHAECSFVH